MSLEQSFRFEIANKCCSIRILLSNRDAIEVFVGIVTFHFFIFASSFFFVILRIPQVSSLRILRHIPNVDKTKATVRGWCYDAPPFRLPCLSPSHE